ncbi:MAG: ABC transporter ATP-binding protein [Pseudomonadota bacterium]
MSLNVRGLSFAYSKGKPVLHDVDFDIAPTERLIALIGPNAAGKSTLFRCIAGMLRPASGTVFLNRDDMTAVDRRDWSKRICYMPQSTASSAALTVFDVVLIARKHLHGWRIADDDIETTEKLLARLGIEHLADSYVGDLSGGQQQMVSIAQALVRNPDIFLLDEPTSALDLKNQLEIMSVIRAATIEREITTIVALHDLNLAARFADRFILLREGQLVEIGTPEDILRSETVEATYGVKLELFSSADGSLVVSATV